MAERAILIDGTTRAGLRAGVQVETLGPVSFRGKTQPVDVFGISVGRNA